MKNFPGASKEFYYDARVIPTSGSGFLLLEATFCERNQ